jgi:hypothetical protein
MAKILAVFRDPPTEKPKSMRFFRYARDGATTKRRFRRWNIVIVSLLAFLVLGAYVANHPLLPRSLTNRNKHLHHMD